MMLSYHPVSRIAIAQNESTLFPCHSKGKSSAKIFLVNKLQKDKTHPNGENTAFSLKYLLSRSLISLMTSYDPESWKLLRIIITVSKDRFQMTCKVFQPNYSSPPQPALRAIDWSSFAKRNTTIDQPNPWRNFSQITPSPRAKTFPFPRQTHTKPTEPSTAQLFQSILPSHNSSPWAIAPATTAKYSFSL